MSETINLSYALDLIAQSKGEIKTSVQGKGGTIGDDLTEYSESIDNIQFRTLSFTKNSVTLNKWSSDSLDMTQYLDGNTSMPDDFTYAMTYVSGADPNANVVMSDNNGAKRFMITPVDYGTSILNVHDDMGNCDYPISVAVNAVDIVAEPDTSSYVGFNSFGYDEMTSELTADWDSTAQSFYVEFALNADSFGVPVSDVHVDFSGEMIDNNLITVSYTGVQGYNNVMRFTFALPTDPMTDMPVQYNGTLMYNITDGHSQTNDQTIKFINGTDYEPATEATYKMELDCQETLEFQNEGGTMSSEPWPQYAEPSVSFGVEGEGGYTELVGNIGDFYIDKTDVYPYMTMSNLSGNDHCSISWTNNGFTATSSDDTAWADTITCDLTFDGASEGQPATPGVDYASNGYNSFQEYVESLPSELQSYMYDDNGEAKVDMSAWNGQTSSVSFTVQYAGSQV